jgi:hypothetical protein
MRQLHLDGIEISVLKAIGIGGSQIPGETLLERITELEEAELLHTLDGLIMLGYVVSDKSSLQTLDDVRRSHFHVNSGYTKELRAALNPGRQPQQSRRRRRE